MALWSGRFTEGVDAFTQRFGASLPVDQKMYAQDIAGSKAHAAMLAAQGVISHEDAAAIAQGCGEEMENEPQRQGRTPRVHEQYIVGKGQRKP